MAQTPTRELRNKLLGVWQNLQTKEHLLVDQKNLAALPFVLAALVGCEKHSLDMQMQELCAKEGLNKSTDFALRR